MIKGNFSNLDAKEIDELPLKGINLKRIGQTKEQLLAKNLKVLAQEYIQLEKTKKNFADLILKNFKKLDFSEFLNYANKKIELGNESWEIPYNMAGVYSVLGELKQRRLKLLSDIDRSIISDKARVN